MFSLLFALSFSAVEAKAHWKPIKFHSIPRIYFSWLESLVICLWKISKTDDFVIVLKKKVVILVAELYKDFSELALKILASYYCPQQKDSFQLKKLVMTILTLSSKI